MKKIKQLLLIAAVTLVAAIPVVVKADLQTIVSGGTVAASITNNYNLPGASTNVGYLYPNPGGVIAANKSTTLTLAVHGTCANTNASATTVTVRFAGSADGSHWTNNASTIVFSAALSSTNTFTALTLINPALPFYALQSVEIPAANLGARITDLNVRAYSKDVQ
jgi:hypothetical protein